MRKFKELKEASTQQMLAMADNLQGKFNKYSNIQLEARKFNQGSVDNGLVFYIYVDDVYNGYFREWKNVCLHYHRLMKTIIEVKDV